MCRSTTTNAGLPRYREHDHDRDRDRLKIDAFYLRLSRSVGEEKQFPETLTLVYLPWMDGVEVNGSKIRAGNPAILALRRVRSTAKESGPLFVSNDRVRTGEDGARFQVYAGEKEVLRGVFRRGGVGGGWTTDCRSNLPGAKVWVTEERMEVMRVKAASGSRKKRRPRFCSKLEDIPEEEEEGCDCCWPEEGKEEEGEEGWEMVRSDGGEWEEGKNGLEIEGVRRAVDVGLWMVCLGVGVLVSKASSRSLRNFI